MPTFTKVHLSGSAGGEPIKIVATSSTGTIVHTTNINSSVIDEIWLYATNTDTVLRALTIEYGGTTNPDNRIIIGIPAQSGLTICLAGLILSGTGVVGRSVTAFASSTNVINVMGYVNRIS
jgi:hypothetical protein